MLVGLIPTLNHYRCSNFVYEFLHGHIVYLRYSLSPQWQGETMGKSRKGGRGGGERNNARPNGKAWKKFIRVYDPEKERLVRVPNKR